MQIKELLERYQKGERHFAHADLKGANLSGVNLQDIDLTGANLTEANLSWAFLNRATLTGACLRRADLRSTSLNNATLNQAVLSGANLSKADLRLSQLQGADLNWAILTEVDLTGADLQAAKLDQANLERAKLNSCRLVAAELMEANLRRTNLAAAVLDQANLREAHLEEANLREATLVGANLNEANLSGTYLRQANLTEADLHRVVLIGADLSEANLTNADLSRANLVGAYLLKACFKKAHLVRANLQEVYLLRADLNEANLRGADLRRADLSGAYLGDATLSEADLNDAYLIESHLIRTNLEGADLTGCCICNWHIEELDFSKATCRYVFMQFNFTTKSPIDRYPVGRDLETGELGQQYQQDSSAIEVYFTEELNWEALVFTLAQVELECHELKLTIHSYERVEGNYLVRLAANRLVNSKILIRRIFQLYPDILQRVLSRRSDLLSLLEIKPQASNLDLVQPAPATEPPPGRTISALDRRERLYQEVVRQIQHILISQVPDQFVTSVQRLLDYLQQQGVATEDLQRKIISQVIIRRAKQDSAFREQLLRWDKSAEAAIRASVAGQAVRVAIGFLWTETRR